MSETAYEWGAASSEESDASSRDTQWALLGIGILDLFGFFI